MKLFGQYSQATKAVPVKSFNPVKTMKAILDNVEKAQKKLSARPSSEAQAPGAEPEQVITVEDDTPDLPGQPRGTGQTQPQEREVNPAHSAPSPSNRARCGGGGVRVNRRGRVHRGQRGGNQPLSNQATGSMNPNDSPVRCSFEISPREC